MLKIQFNDVISFWFYVSRQIAILTSTCNYPVLWDFLTLVLYCYLNIFWQQRQILNIRFKRLFLIRTDVLLIPPKVYSVYDDNANTLIQMEASFNCY